VDGTKPDEIADAVIKVLADPELAKKYADAGRDWIVSEWRWEIWSERFNKLLLD
jgi:phosphatidylinositol alpha-1,6-mannosyltransferase